MTSTGPIYCRIVAVPELVYDIAVMYVSCEPLYQNCEYDKFYTVCFYFPYSKAYFFLSVTKPYGHRITPAESILIEVR